MSNVPNATGSMREEEYNPFEGYVSIAPAKTDNAPMQNCPVHYPPERHYFPQQVPPQKERPNAFLILLGIGIALYLCVLAHVALAAIGFTAVRALEASMEPVSYEEVAGSYRLSVLASEYLLVLRDDGTYTLYLTDTSEDYIFGNFSLGPSMRTSVSADEAGQTMFLRLTYSESYLDGVRGINPAGHDDRGKQLASGFLFISDSGEANISQFSFSYGAWIERLDD